MLQRDAGLEPRDDLRVVPGEVPAHPRRERRGHPDVDLARRHGVEGARHDADHFIGLVVERNPASGDIRGAAEPALPQSVADDDDTLALVVFVLGEDTPEHRLHTKHAPEGPRDLPRGNLLGVAVARERRVASLTRREVREDGIETPPLDPFSGCGVRRRRDVGVAHLVPDHDETAGVGIWQGADQHGIEGAEHRRHPADAERERRNRDRCERRIAPELPHPVTRIPAGHVEPGAVTAGPNALLHLLHTAHLKHRQAAGLGGRRAVADVIGGSHVDERVELIVHVCLGLAPAESPSRNGREPIQEHQAPSRTLMTANDTRFHRSRCCSSWRLPEAVSR